MNLKRGLARAVIVALSMGATAVGPAAAVTVSGDCNWLGRNCKSFWDHGTAGTSVWSNYKHHDVNHGSSTAGNTKAGVHKTHQSKCMGPSTETWAKSSLADVTSARESFYRKC